MSEETETREQMMNGVEVEDRDTKHEAHKHAQPRLLVGVGAVVLILIVGGFIWSRWGAQIQEACFGEDACTIELPTEPGATSFENPDPELFQD